MTTSVAGSAISPKHKVRSWLGVRNCGLVYPPRWMVGLQVCFFSAVHLPEYIDNVRLIDHKASLTMLFCLCDFQFKRLVLTLTRTMYPRDSGSCFVSPSNSTLSFGCLGVTTIHDSAILPGPSLLPDGLFQTVSWTTIRGWAPGRPQNAAMGGDGEWFSPFPHYSLLFLFFFLFFFLELVVCTER
ncbi:hypothetical protein VTI74DRAFT_3270 [Chaetomium olivicolor]